MFLSIVRDEWEANTPKFQEDLSNLLGQPWHVEVDASLIYANVDDETYKPRVGEFINE